MTKSTILKISLILIAILVVGGAIYFFDWRILLGGPKTVDPSNTAVEFLEGTNDIRITGEQNFSISPDGTWILYYSEQGNPFEPVYVLYDIEKRERHGVGLSSRAKDLAAEGRGPLRDIGCWDRSGEKVVLREEIILFALDVSSNHLEWEVLENVDAATLSYYRNCPSTSPQFESKVKVNQASPKEVHLVDAQNPERILATHEAHGATVHRILIQYPTISPDGKHVAYIVTEFRGTFVASSYGYILDITPESPTEAKPLADPVFGPIRWSPDSAFVYASAREFRKGDGIYRWRIGK